MRDDVRYAIRTLLKNPGFTAAAVTVLALGIGANVTSFSFVNALALRPLPVQRPHELVYFRSPSFSYPIFQHVKQKGLEGSPKAVDRPAAGKSSAAADTGVFSNVAAWSIEEFVVNWHGEPETTEVLVASAEFYRTLGVGAALGRTFSEADDRLGGGPQGPVAVISEACWEKRFGRDPAVIGRHRIGAPDISAARPDSSRAKWDSPPSAIVSWSR